MHRRHSTLSAAGDKIGKKDIAAAIELAKTRRSQLIARGTGELSRFSPQSMELLRKHGAIPAG